MTLLKCIFKSLSSQGVRHLCTPSVLFPRAVKLSHLVYETSTVNPTSPPLIIIHGLFGSKKNWHSLASKFSLLGRQVVTVDARNHGDSPHVMDMDYHVMSDDIELLMSDLQIPQADVLGHSMGGKIAMTLALTKPHLVSKLIVEDVSPDTTRKAEQTSMPMYIKAMKKVRFRHSGSLGRVRSDVGKQLRTVFPNRSVKDFILTNVMKSGLEYQWRMNLDSIEKNADCLVGFPQLSATFTGDTFFLGGKESQYISESMHDEIVQLFPKVKFELIDGAGHWVHTDRPQQFMDAVIKFLDSS